MQRLCLLVWTWAGKLGKLVRDKDLRKISGQNRDEKGSPMLRWADSCAFLSVDFFLTCPFLSFSYLIHSRCRSQRPKRSTDVELCPRKRTKTNKYEGNIAKIRNKALTAYVLWRPTEKRLWIHAFDLVTFQWKVWHCVDWVSQEDYKVWTPATVASIIHSKPHFTIQSPIRSRIEPPQFEEFIYSSDIGYVGKTLKCAIPHLVLLH